MADAAVSVVPKKGCFVPLLHTHYVQGQVRCKHFFFFFLISF